MAIAIVTGASQGFGRVLASALVRDGWTVIGDARGAAALETVAGALEGPGRFIGIPGDVADAAHRTELVRAASGAGGLDLLVHNASELGPSPLPALTDMPLTELRRVYEVNVVAPLALTQDALPLLAASGSPTIVTLTSDAAVEPYATWGGYGSSKAALDQLAAILGAEQPAVHVYAFDPGDMNTAMHQAAFPGEDISDRADPATVVPALLTLLRRRPASGRYRAADISREAAA